MVFETPAEKERPHLNRQTAAVTLPPDFAETERGNNWLTTEDGLDHLFIVKLPVPGHWLIQEIRHANYPGANISTAMATESQLVHWIEMWFAGWVIRRINISVPASWIESGSVPELPYEDEYVEDEDEDEEKSA